MNCKPGDLAIVVRVDGPEDRDVIGLIVEVLRPCPPNEWEEVSEPEWECRSRSPVRAQCDGKRVFSSEFDVRDSWLRPLSGVPITDDIKDEAHV